MFMKEGIWVGFLDLAKVSLRASQKSFELVFLLQGSNLPTEEELSRRGTTLENVDEFLKQNDSANGMNSSEEDNCFRKNEEGN